MEEKTIKIGDPITLTFLEEPRGIAASIYTDEEYARPEEKERVIILWWNQREQNLFSQNLPIQCVKKITPITSDQKDFF